MTPTAPADLNRINGMFRTVAPMVAQLAGRWLDEKDFEDINDYGNVIRGNLPEGFTLSAMTKRPFGFKFSIGTDATYHMTVTARGAAQWKRVS